MDMNKKYEQLINLVINEDTEQANELFHEIVIEKSRQIYESMMAEDMEEEMGGQVGDLLDEINAEETGMNEEEDEFEFGAEDGEGDFDDVEIDTDTLDDQPGEVEDAVIRIEDKLDQLLAEFDDIINGASGEDDAVADADFDVDGDVDVDGTEDEFNFDVSDEDDGEDADQLAEAVQLQKVTVSHGDNGAYTKSPTAFNSGKAGMDSKPVNFTDSPEKGRTAPPVKDLKGAGQFKNAPGHKSIDLSAAPKPKTADGSSNDRSPVAESRLRAKRRPIR